MFDKIEDALLAASGLLGGGSGGGGGGGSATLIEKSVTANATYKASDDNADGYSKVTVNVANTYAAGDEGKVVSDGALVAQTSDTVTQNGTVDTTLINSLTVNVPVGTQIQAPYKVASGKYTPASDGKKMYLPLGSSGITTLACVYVECEDTADYATTYDAYKPVLLYLMYAYPHNIFGTGGNLGTDISYLASDGTLGSYSTLGGGSSLVVSDNTLTITWTQGVQCNTGVTYNYIVVGV